MSTLSTRSKASGSSEPYAGITIDGSGELSGTGHTLPVLDVGLMGVFE